MACPRFPIEFDPDHWIALISRNIEHIYTSIRPYKMPCLLKESPTQRIDMHHHREHIFNVQHSRLTLFTNNRSSSTFMGLHCVHRIDISDCRYGHTH